jgi:hypothetical protein
LIVSVVTLEIVLVAHEAQEEVALVALVAILVRRISGGGFGLVALRPMFAEAVPSAECAGSGVVVALAVGSAVLLSSDVFERSVEIDSS